MPITQGAGNPDWQRDETLLALDLLYRHDRAIDKHHDDVVELSSLLRSALIHPHTERKPSFRNADGVALKIQNLLSAVDPTRGLSSSRLDRELVSEFPRQRATELAELAAKIRSAIFHGEAVEALPEVEAFAEGHLLTSVHRRRDRRLRKTLLAQKSDEALICAVCDFKPPKMSRSLRESFFETHHVRPLAEFAGTTTTRVSDLSLLCAGCHRFVHRLIASRRGWVSVADARDLRRGDERDG